MSNICHWEWCSDWHAKLREKEELEKEAKGVGGCRREGCGEVGEGSTVRVVGWGSFCTSCN